MSNSPLNISLFGNIASSITPTGAYNNLSDQQLRDQYDMMQQRIDQGGGFSNMFQGPMQAIIDEIQRRNAQGSGLTSGDFNSQFLTQNRLDSAADIDYGVEANPMMGPVTEATGAPGSETGNFSDGSLGFAVNRFGGFAGTTGGGMLTAGMAMGNAPLPTAGGGFNVQTEAAAQGVFGDPEQRQAAMGAAERLQESLNDPLTKSRKLKRKRLRSLESGMRGFGFVPGDIL
tara:strand:+ start:121 stop:810 length:690 start_codon:yes stop_codon:yes gene_type:complete